MKKIIAKALAKEPLNNITYLLFGHYVTIFMLHRPARPGALEKGHDLQILDQCLNYARKKQFHFATPDEIWQMARDGVKPKRPTLCFTIDDGYADELTEIVPVFLKYNIQPTLYVLTDFIDRKLWPWDAKMAYLLEKTELTSASIKPQSTDIQLDLSDRRSRLRTWDQLDGIAKTMQHPQVLELLDQMSHQLQVKLPKKIPDNFLPATWDQLKEFEQKGLIVGSHACTHRTLNSIPDNEVLEELIRSKEELAQQLKNPSNIFCYPSGTNRDFSERHQQLVKQAGYIGAVSANPGNTTLTHIQQSPYNVLRHAFPNHFDTFVRYCSWFEALRTQFA